MRICFFKLAVVLVGLFLLRGAQPVSMNQPASNLSTDQTSAASAPVYSSLALIETSGHRESAANDRPSATPRIAPDAPLDATLHPGDEIAPAFVPSNPPHPDDDLVLLARYAREKRGSLISGRIMDINNKPVADVTLWINGEYGATSDDTGRYRLANLVTRTFTVTPSKPNYTFSPALRTVDPQADIGEQDFTVEPDLGFRPWRDGYSFNNPGQAVPDCTAFQRSFGGLGIRCAYNQPQQRYLALFDRYKFSFQSGVCTGMAATSLAYYVRLIAPTRSVATYQLSFDESWPDIATFHGRQYSKAVLDRRFLELSKWDRAEAISQRVDNVYRQLRLAVQPGNRDPVVLDLVSRPDCEASGHTVTPYRLDETDPYHPKVYVYENYSAGDPDKFIQFDFAASEHRFSYSKWDSAECGALIAIPISAFFGPGHDIPSTHLPEESSLESQDVTDK